MGGRRAAVLLESKGSDSEKPCARKRSTAWPSPVGGAAFLYTEGVTRVWVFGSVAKGRGLDFRSDLDFAVEGLEPSKYLRLGAELEALLELPVDLVEIETADPVLRDQIVRYGKMISREN